MVLRNDEVVLRNIGVVLCNDGVVLCNDGVVLCNASLPCSICHYSVIPLSWNSGLIGWVPHSDTLQRKIMLNMKHRLMLQVRMESEGLDQGGKGWKVVGN